MWVLIQVVLLLLFLVHEVCFYAPILSRKLAANNIWQAILATSPQEAPVAPAIVTRSKAKKK